MTPQESVAAALQSQQAPAPPAAAPPLAPGTPPVKDPWMEYLLNLPPSSRDNVLSILRSLPVEKQQGFRRELLVR